MKQRLAGLFLPVAFPFKIGENLFALDQFALKKVKSLLDCSNLCFDMLDVILGKTNSFMNFRFIPIWLT